MTTEAEIRLIAKDEASKAIQNVRDNLTKMEGTSNSASKAMGGLGTSLGQVAKIAAGFVVAQGLLKLPGLIAGTVGAASNMQESLTKIDAVFGDNAEAIKKWAEGSAKAFGQSKQQALEAAGTYGNLFQAFGIGRDAATDMSKSLVELSADLASFNNTSIEDALLAIRSGLSGETEPLKRFGVALSDDRLKAEALAMGLMKGATSSTAMKEAQLKLTEALAKQKDVLKKHSATSIEGQKAAMAVEKAQAALGKTMEGTTTKALDPATKAQAAYALIMKDTALAQGDFSRTSSGLANQQRIFAAQMKDLQVTIGEAFLPLFVTLITILNNQGIPAFQKIGAVVTTTVAPAIATISAAIPVLIGHATKLWQEISKNQMVMDLLGGVLKGVIIGAIAAVAIAIGSFVVGIAGAVAPILILVGVLGGLGVALQKAGVDFGAILSFLKDQIPVAVTFVQEQFAKLSAYFESDLKPALQNVIAAVKAVVDFIKDNWGTIGPIVKAVVDQVVGYYKLLWNTFSNAIAIVVDLIQGDWAGAWKNAKELVGGFIEYFKETIGNVKTILSGIGKLALEGVGSLITVLWDAGTDLIKGLMRGIEEKAKELPGFIKDKVTDLIPEWFKNPLKINSPSLVMVPVGEQVAAGIAKGIIDGTDKYIKPAMDGMAKFVESSAYNPALVGGGWGGSGDGYPPQPHYKSGPAGTTPGRGPGYVESSAWNPALAGGSGGKKPTTSSSGGGVGAKTSPITVQKPTVQSPTVQVVKAYAKGTSYVPNDGLAYLHRGEAVIPSNQNRGPSLEVNFAGAVFYGSVDNRMLEQIASYIRDKALGGGFRGVFASP